jgi:hypothetical protein
MFVLQVAPSSPLHAPLLLHIQGGPGHVALQQ